MIDELLDDDHPMGEVKLKEVLGHTPRQVRQRSRAAARRMSSYVTASGASNFTCETGVPGYVGSARIDFLCPELLHFSAR